jgi:single-strand DNA-binding protein
VAGSVNKVVLIGRLGKDAEIRTTQDGKEIANFTLATSESWKDKSGERKERVEWHRVVVYNPHLINTIKNYTSKGSNIYLEGSLQTRKWQNKEGQDQYTTEIVLQQFNGTIVLLDSKKEGQDAHSEAKSNGYAPKDADNGFDDDSSSIPF